MEKLEVLDKSGKPTGQVKSRDEIHRDGDWHFSVHCWIINSKGELLIQKRSPQKESAPNMWDDSVAGHVAVGEAPIDVAIREFKEELGIDLKKEDFELIFTVKRSKVLNNGTFFNNEINPVYLVKKDIDLSNIKLQTKEVSEVKWIFWKKLEKKILSKDENFIIRVREHNKLFEYLRNTNK